MGQTDFFQRMLATHGVPTVATMMASSKETKGAAAHVAFIGQLPRHIASRGLRRETGRHRPRLYSFRNDRKKQTGCSIDSASPWPLLPSSLTIFSSTEPQ